MRLLLPAAWVVLTACGGFDNGPLRVGEVKGQLSRVTPGRAFVAVLGEPESKLDVDASGSFTLKGVSAGARELLAVGGNEAAARVAVNVAAASVVDLGSVALYPAGEIEVVPLAPDHQKLSGAAITVAGTPWQQVPANSEGKLEIVGVPSGCWTVLVAVPGLAASTGEVCVDPGEHKRADLSLPAADGKSGSEGCRVTGCEVGYSCEGDGACR